ncbi:Gfo/Idh/MocA family protein [Liquorilactobacillus mali]|uniref:Myo-inositol 2-dehydrogenase n=1 Tax=Liquorilactobacillus mali KCTC 3596 = DSM 20444 TaxID=1046596 RepID=A0A0R2E412_9LACO|nr:Gfo/Idh/MocA family oxidoreductase [Liquorilactobacillus mali]KRN11070.1 myo-inositol 2-dehydrogenase [Liquorilactobacillus mali KCTC 3596 = DSM 20444]QFQ75563.1 Gfo/Idh/MocA family oxidoreductase [Liquorilactobacillus mali]
MLRLGLVGCGAIAHTHTANIVNKLKGAQITFVFDVFSAAAQKIVRDYNLTAKIASSIDELVNSEEVDAVLVCSRNDAHVEPILAAIKAHKPVFSEKPLATTYEDCQKIVAAEIEENQRFLQVGFMRRYDPFYQQLKQTIDGGKIGKPLMGYCRHFTAEPATNYFETPNMINDAFIHEIDIIHWLFGDDYVSVQVQYARQNSLNKNDNLVDPQIATVKMKQGAIVNTYLTQNSQYGYDVKCQIIGEKGIAELPDMPKLEMHSVGKIYHEIDHDWTYRFEEAYQLEMQDFIDQATRHEAPTGPTAWDGLVAALTADNAVESQQSQQVVEIKLPERPVLYQ